MTSNGVWLFLLSGTKAPTMFTARDFPSGMLSRNRKGRIKDRTHARTACDFYNRYREDIFLARSLGFTVFRFSLSWPRIMPKGTGAVNQPGIDFYHRVIDYRPGSGHGALRDVISLDLPQALEQRAAGATAAPCSLSKNSPTFAPVRMAIK